MKTLRSTILLAAMLAAASAAQAREGEGGGGDKPCPDGRRGPPPQAIEACSSSAEGARCSFIGRNDQAVNGECLNVRDGLACVPDDAPRPPRGGGRDDGGQPPQRPEG